MHIYNMMSSERRVATVLYRTVLYVRTVQFITLVLPVVLAPPTTEYAVRWCTVRYGNAQGRWVCISTLY